MLNRDSRFSVNDKPYFALNGIMKSHKDNSFVYQSEPSNELCFELEQGYFVIGSIFLNDRDVVIFSTNNTLSKIGLQSDCTYTELVSIDLGFNLDNVITGTFRVRNGCERVIYWNDGVNPDRYLNLDQLEQFKTDGEFDANKFSFLPEIQPPTVNLVSVNDTGGRLSYGSYWFQVEYLDAANQSIYTSELSAQVPIAQPSSSYTAIQGGFNIATNQADFGGKPITSKSITLSVTNIDPIAEYIKINVVRQITGDGITRDAHSVATVFTTSDNLTFVYKGVNTAEGDTFLDVNEVLVQNSMYKTSKTMEQVQGRLVRANVSEAFRDYSKTQRLASKVKVKYLTKDIEKRSNKTGDAKQGKTYWYGSTFQSNEVYAAGIRYKYPDGTKSPTFHVPGRTKTAADVGTISPFLDNIPSCAQLSGPIGNDLCNPATISSEPELWQVESTAYRSGGSVTTGISTDNIYEYEILNHDLEGTITINNTTITRFASNATAPMSSYILAAEIEDSNFTPGVTYSKVRAEIIYTGANYCLRITSSDALTIAVDPNILELKTFIDLGAGTGVPTEINPCYATSGTLGYHQNCNSFYIEPDIPCADGESYWGLDAEGNALANTPIRHHRMPCRKLEPLHDLDENTFRVIGLQYENIELPEGAIDYEIMIGHKTEDQRLVLDSGIMYRNIDCENKVVNAFMGARGGNTDKFTNNYTAFLGPKSLTDRQISGANFVKFNGIYQGTGGKTTGFDGAKNITYIDDSLDDQDSEKEAKDIILISHLTSFTDYPVSTQESKTIETEYHISPTSQIRDSSTSLVNLSQANPWHVIKLNEQLDEHSWDFADVQLMRVADVHSNLDSITYYKAACEDSDISFDGGSFISPFPINNYLLYDFDNSAGAFGVILKILAFALAGAIAVATAGSLGIPALALAGTIAASIGIATTGIEAIIKAQAEGQYDCALEDVEPFGLADPVDKGTSNKDSFGNFIRNKDRGWFYTAQFFDSMWVESPVNYSLTHGSINPCSATFTDTDLSFREDFSLTSPQVHALNKEVAESFSSYVLGKVTYVDTEESIAQPKFPACPEVYYYNKDYNFRRADISISLPRTFNFCSECVTSLPNRVLYSPKSFDEEIQDTYRTHYTNDYIDIPAHRGGITKLKYKNNNLLIHTTNSCFVIKPNPQSLSTNEDTVYLTTSDFLSLPSTELIQTDLGYGGLQHILATADSEYGYMWVDAANGKVFMFTNQINEVSKNGLEQWFKENTSSNTENFRLGIRCVYDPRFNRYIISHRDFNGLENLSYTISSDSENWVSFHSYLPNYIYNNSTHYFTTVNNRVLRHRHDSYYTKFNGVQYPFIIDYNQYNPITSDLHAVHYVANVDKFENGYYQLQRDKTFTEGIFYSKDETTGLQTLSLLDQQANPYSNLTYLEDSINIIRTDDNYKISQIIDYSTNNPVMSHLWSDKETLFNQYGYIDEVPINFDLTKDQYQLKDINKKQLRSRLIFQPEDQERISIDIITNNEQQSIR